MSVNAVASQVSAKTQLRKLFFASLVGQSVNTEVQSSTTAVTSEGILFVSEPKVDSTNLNLETSTEKVSHMSKNVDNSCTPQWKNLPLLGM